MFLNKYFKHFETNTNSNYFTLSKISRTNIYQETSLRMIYVYSSVFSGE